MSIASFVAVLVVLCWSGASAQARTPVLSGGAASFLSASGTSVVGFSLVNTEPGAGTRIPANLEIPAALRSDVARMIRSSPTFRRQCARIAEAAARIVVLVMPASDRRLTRSHAASSIDRDNGQLAATVILGSPHLRDQSEYLAHEIEHVLEQIEGVDLTSAVAKGVRGARRIDGGRTFETDRATAVGRLVAGETRSGA